MSDVTLPPADSVVLLEWLRPVQDPELFLGLVDLGLIYSVNLEGDTAHVKMTLTSPGCPSAGYLVDQVKNRLQEYPGIAKAEVQIVFDPKWDPRVMASDEVKDKLGIW
ncbi:MAG: metal-sulfur cluster assembly factor [Bdellovibrionota bacterium]